MTSVLGVAYADFLERSRRYSFSVTLLVMIWAAHVFMPPVGAKYVTMAFDVHRGYYNSAWVGAQLAMLASSFLGLAGFYIVKNAIDRDRMTRVGQVLAAARLSRLSYLLAKWLSNVMVFASMLAVLGVSGAVLQLVRGEVRILDPVALALPLLLLTLPYLALVAACAVLFEAIPLLRGGFGNFAWFWIWGLSLNLMRLLAETGTNAVGDLMGATVLFPSMAEACNRAFPGAGVSASTVSVGVQFSDRVAQIGLRRFPWDGPGWTVEVVGARLAWFGVAAAIVALAAVPFDRFANEATPRARRWALSLSWGRKRSKAIEAGDEREAAAIVGGAMRPSRSPALPAERLASLAPVRRFDLVSLVVAELKIALSGLSRWWYLGALGLVIAGLVVPHREAARVVSAFAWIWPALVWSPLGTREARFGTGPLLYSSPRPVGRQVMAAWVAGVLIAAAVTGPLALRLAMWGQGAGVAAWIAGVAFVPAFALSSGIVTGNSRLFEAAYLLVWYLGPLNGVAELDFGGVMVPAGAFGTAAWLAVTTALLLGGALWRRRVLVAG